ncbi:MAG: FG-GAP repeat domain-containing protein [Desulfomonilaceae bacterium]
MILSRSRIALAFLTAVIGFTCFFSFLAEDFALSAESGKILVLPFQVAPGADEKELQGFSEHVNKRLRATIEGLNQNFSTESVKATEELLKGRPAPTSDVEARTLASKSGADLVIYGFLSRDDSRHQMKGYMWDMRTGRVVVSIDMKVANIHALPGVLQLFVNSINTRLHGSQRLPFYKSESAGSAPISRSDRLPTLVDLPQNTAPWRSPDIGGALWALDIGDLDGDKKNETVLLERGGITISRFEGGSLVPLTQFSQPPAAYISAEVEDLDGDGVDELLLCYQMPSGIESAVIRYTNRNFKVIGKFPNMILRTVRESVEDKKRILVGQRTDGDDMFSGEMVRFEFEGGEFVPSGKLMLPPGTLLLSYDSGLLGKQGQFVRIILNQDQRLMVFDRENRLLCHVSDRLYGLDRRIRIPSKRGAREISLPGRILIARATGGSGGENELMVIKQAQGRSVIQALEWDGKELGEKWRTVESQGIISDFRIRDFKNEGLRSLVLMLVKQNPFAALTGPRSVIFAYDLIP